MSINYILVLKYGSPPPKKKTPKTPEGLGKNWTSFCQCLPAGECQALRQVSQEAVWWDPTCRSSGPLLGDETEARGTAPRVGWLGGLAPGVIGAQRRGPWARTGVLGRLLAEVELGLGGWRALKSCRTRWRCHRHFVTVETQWAPEGVSRTFLAILQPHPCPWQCPQAPAGACGNPACLHSAFCFHFPPHDSETLIPCLPQKVSLLFHGSTVF